MPTTIVRQIAGEEMLEIMYRLNSYAFHASPPRFDKEKWQAFVNARHGVTCFALFDEGKAVATAASTTAIQNVRGALLPMAAIWGVVSDPAARRKGYARRTLAALLAHVRAQHPVSCLYPFRESFYERLGYATFPLPRTAHFEPASLLSVLSLDLQGEVTRFLNRDGYDAYDAYLHTQQARVHGMALFPHVNPVALERFPSWLALARVDGAPVGMMAYKLEGDRPTTFTMKVLRFYYHTPAGRYLLLDWIARHTDQAATVALSLPPAELPETWLADLKVRVETDVRAPMARIIDVAALPGLETGPGRFTFTLDDPFCPWQQGTWQFATVDGRLQVAPAADAACTLTSQALAALIYGTHDPADFPLRGWGDPSPAHQATLRAMFPARLPFLHEYF